MKRSELAKYIKETIVDVLSEVSQEDVDLQQQYNKALEDTAALEKQLSSVQKEDINPTISKQLNETVKEMRSTVKKWKLAEGEDKDKLFARLKELTKIKNELESLR